MYYRVHRRGIPDFSAENAFSEPWGGRYETCIHCGGEGQIYIEEYASLRSCCQCGGTGEVDLRVRGYSCCESAAELIRYFENRGGCDDDTPVAIFHGKQVGAGPDEEPLVIPHGQPRWTTYGALKAHIERRR